jgi:hypothetical protein
MTRAEMIFMVVIQCWRKGLAMARDPAVWPGGWTT